MRVPHPISFCLFIRAFIGVGVRVRSSIVEGMVGSYLSRGCRAMPIYRLCQASQVDLWNLKDELEGAKPPPEVVVCDVRKRLEHPGSQRIMPSGGRIQGRVVVHNGVIREPKSPGFAHPISMGNRRRGGAHVYLRLALLSDPRGSVHGYRSLVPLREDPDPRGDVISFPRARIGPLAVDVPAPVGWSSISRRGVGSECLYGGLAGSWGEVYHNETNRCLAPSGVNHKDAPFYQHGGPRFRIFF